MIETEDQIAIGADSWQWPESEEGCRWSSGLAEFLRDACNYGFSALGLICIFPLFLVIALLIRLDSGRPIFFRQKRVGRHGRVFWIVKFRTMLANQAGSSITRANDRRLTRVGKWLRRYKLDELPQLWNVLEGEMGLVGPRPEVPELQRSYPAAWRAAISSIKPGITGLASLMMRDESELFHQDEGPIESLYLQGVVPAKLKVEFRYLLRRSLLYDFKILACSALYVLFPRASVRRFVCRALSI